MLPSGWLSTGEATCKIRAIRAIRVQRRVNSYSFREINLRARAKRLAISCISSCISCENNIPHTVGESTYLRSFATHSWAFTLNTNYHEWPINYHNNLFSHQQITRDDTDFLSRSALCLTQNTQNTQKHASLTRVCLRTRTLGATAKLRAKLCNHFVNFVDFV